MLYIALFTLHGHYPGLNVLRYVTFRSVLAGLSALALSLALGPVLIERFRKAHIGQTIRDEVPTSHQKKAGTPTMGGVLILASTSLATLLLADLGWFYIPFAMLVIVGASNAVNLTDGLDGLAIGPVMTVAFCYWVFTYAA